MAKAWIPSEDDRRLIQQLLNRERQRGGNPSNRPHALPDVPLAPEVYVARTPAGGIPARAAGVLGYATCQIYQVKTADDAPSLYATGVVRRVHNLTATPVAGDAYVLAWRDKFGSWYTFGATPVGGVINVVNLYELGEGTGTGTGTSDADVDEFTFYWNEFNHTLNILIQGFWWTFCPCEPGTGTGTISAEEEFGPQGENKFLGGPASGSDAVPTFRVLKTPDFGTTVALTDGASVAWDLDAAPLAKVTLGGNRTLSNPTNMHDGGSYILRITQDGTGTRTLAYGSAYKWPGGTDPVLSTAAGAIDIITFVSDGTSMFGVIQKGFAV